MSAADAPGGGGIGDVIRAGFGIAGAINRALGVGVSPEQQRAYDAASAAGYTYTAPAGRAAVGGYSWTDPAGNPVGKREVLRAGRALQQGGAPAPGGGGPSPADQLPPPTAGPSWAPWLAGVLVAFPSKSKRTVRKLKKGAKRLRLDKRLRDELLKRSPWLARVAAQYAPELAALGRLRQASWPAIAVEVVRLRQKYVQLGAVAGRRGTRPAVEPIPKGPTSRPVVYVPGADAPKPAPIPKGPTSRPVVRPRTVVPGAASTSSRPATVQPGAASRPATSSRPATAPSSAPATSSRPASSPATWPSSSPFPPPPPAPRAPTIPRWLTTVAPFIAPSLFPVQSPSRGPRIYQQPPLTVGSLQPVASPAPYPLAQTAGKCCPCRKPKSGKARKTRSECWSGTYRETATGTRKSRKRKVAC